MKKGQTWMTDFFFGTALFAIMLFIALNVIFNLEFSSSFDDLRKDANYAASILLSQGYPFDWDENNVAVPGLTTNNRLDHNKLESFNNLDYTTQKFLLLLNADFLLTFKSDGDYLNLTSCSFGHPINHDSDCNFDLSLFDYDNLVLVNRLVLNGSNMVEMVLYVWE